MVEIGQGFLGVFFLPFGTIRAAKIERRIKKYIDDGYGIVATEWCVNRFLLI